MRERLEVSKYKPGQVINVSKAIKIYQHIQTSHIQTKNVAVRRQIKRTKYNKIKRNIL